MINRSKPKTDYYEIVYSVDSTRRSVEELVAALPLMAVLAAQLLAVALADHQGLARRGGRNAIWLRMTQIHGLSA